MMRPYLKIILLIGICSPARALLCEHNGKIAEPRHELAVFAGFSPDSMALFGTAADRRFVLAGGTYSYLCRVWGSTSISYTGALMPAAIVIQPRRAGNRTVYGFAAIPAGFTIDFARRRRIHPFAENLLGIIASARPVPIEAPNATGLNFVISAGGGVRWNLRPRRALSIGYQLFHISNAGTTAYNPGLDNNVIYVQYSFGL